MKNILTILCVFVLSACDVDVNEGGVDAKDNNQTLTYSYTVNGCATGQHSFSSLTAMCRALADDALNNNCAGGVRCERFKQDCHGLSLDVTCD